MKLLSRPMTLHNLTIIKEVKFCAKAVLELVFPCVLGLENRSGVLLFSFATFVNKRAQAKKTPFSSAFLIAFVVKF